MRTTPQAVFFHGGLFSQWASTPVDGRVAWRHMKRLLADLGISGQPDDVEISGRLRSKTYPNAEAWMMAAKAWLMNDLASLLEIQKTSDPSAAKALGRNVRPFDKKLWDDACVPVVTAGSIAKFTASDRMRDELLRTGDRVLVEGSPRNRIWGVGISWRDDAILDSRNWRGRNLLGECLMAARKTITDGT